jgi:hypothetical protein
MKRLVIILLVVVFGLLVIYLGFWYRYKKSMDEVNRDWYEKEYVGKEIKGVLKSITEFNDNPFKIVLGIQNNQDEFEITYGVTCVDKEFRDFVQVGDSVFKTQGEKPLRFCKSNSNCREFELNFCNKLK